MSETKRTEVWKHIRLASSDVPEGASIYDAAYMMAKDIIALRKRVIERDVLVDRIDAARVVLNGGYLTDLILCKGEFDGRKPQTPRCEVVDELIGLLTSAELRIEP